ncbi:MAG: tetratricopeptide repeat protein [Thermoplasmatales archaeon]|nr:tetratricopeptide repeat protein [Thermoplasmatales archaeon]
MPGSDGSDALRVPPDRRVELAFGQDLLRRGSAAQALEHFRNVLKTHPRDPEARRGFAEASLEVGAFDDARRTVDAILAESPKDIEMWRLAARIDRETGDAEGLLRCLTEIRTLDPNDRRVALDLYHLYDIQGDREAAYRALGEAIADEASPSPDEPYGNLLLARAELAHSLGHTEEAEAGFARAVEAEPALIRRVTLWRAKKEFADGRPDLALEQLRTAFGSVGVAQRPPEALALEGEVLLSTERTSEAQSLYDAWHAHDPTSATALVGAARCRIEQGKHPEARDLLHEGLAHASRNESLVLCLAEAESGSGDLSAAERAVRDGIELFTESERLHVRLAELATARNDWEGADRAYARAEELNPTSVGIALGRAFVAEKRNDPEKALAEYARAAEVAPNDVRVWNRQGALLLSLRRPSQAVTSFEHALRIDPESDVARDGKRIADREARNRTVDDFALAALRSEHELGRPVTKSDLFVGLHVPFDLLDGVLAAMARETKVDISALSPSDLEVLERRSRTLVERAAEQPSSSGDARSLTLVDVAALADPADALSDVQRLFAYVDAVLKMDLRPENLHLTPEMEDTARQALALPPEERSLFGIVRALHIGVYRARIVKAVERSSATPRTPLPTVDLAAHVGAGPDADGDGSRFFSSENIPNVPYSDPSRLAEGEAPRARPRGWPAGIAPLPTSRSRVRDRCLGCGGLASLQHDCGGSLCRLCASQFQNCPRCRAPIGPLHVASKRTATSRSPGRSSTATRLAARVTAAIDRAPSTSPVPRSAPARPAKPPAPTARSPKPDVPTASAGPIKTGSGPAGARSTSAPAAKATAAPTPAPPAPKPVRREKVDDEPRL